MDSFSGLGQIIGPLSLRYVLGSRPKHSSLYDSRDRGDNDAQDRFERRRNCVDRCIGNASIRSTIAAPSPQVGARDNDRAIPQRPKCRRATATAELAILRMVGARRPLTLASAKCIEASFVPIGVGKDNVIASG
ncbi:hypothetical protein [Bradyrhizobium genosp. SA-3]|uniref:hypothetical protein n=1 Tax=Bradyrhizobium genosp. SA-3 TaxID=508868 RepID=UPI0013EE933E|nr:hypothetical protein [Bradyrhizobium genosp. SA-3]